MGLWNWNLDQTVSLSFLAKFNKTFRYNFLFAFSYNLKAGRSICQRNHNVHVVENIHVCINELVINTVRVNTDPSIHPSMLCIPDNSDQIPTQM